MSKRNLYLIIYQKRGEFLPTNMYALTYASSKNVALNKAKKHFPDCWIKEIREDFDHNLIENDPFVKQI